MDKQLACRLVQACDLAYHIKVETATIADSPEAVLLLNTIKLKPETIRVSAHGDELIDACFYAETTDGLAILAFRGTLPPNEATGGFDDLMAVAKDWLGDAEARLIQDPNFPGRVHEGFCGSLQNLWPDITTFIQQGSGAPLYVTGHSKGGSLSHLAGYRLADPNTGIPVQAVYSFAAARAGDTDFVAGFNTLMPNCWRFEYRDDMVPHLPPATGGWLTQLTNMRLGRPTHGFSILGAAGHWFEGLLPQLAGAKSYGSAGKLQFIDWADPPIIQPASATLDAERQASLARKLFSGSFGEIAGDHSSGIGYHWGVCGGAKPIS